ncbi:hypothetical protein D3C81_2173910 [compost metagenome]
MSSSSTVFCCTSGSRLTSKRYDSTRRRRVNWVNSSRFLMLGTLVDEMFSAAPRILLI